ncbi:uncharacterized protein [Musca autumnalis]|uniref:uncharacterized protein n=1 Tax=Musca autumnalis TaxID=221902 RepID=UPI003CEB9991
MVTNGNLRPLPKSCMWFQQRHYQNPSRKTKNEDHDRPVCGTAANQPGGDNGSGHGLYHDNGINHGNGWYRQQHQSGWDNNGLYHDNGWYGAQPQRDQLNHGWYQQPTNGWCENNGGVYNRQQHEQPTDDGRRCCRNIARCPTVDSVDLLNLAILRSHQIIND